MISFYQTGVYLHCILKICQVGVVSASVSDAFKIRVSLYQDIPDIGQATSMLFYKYNSCYIGVPGKDVTDMIPLFYGFNNISPMVQETFCL